MMSTKTNQVSDQLISLHLKYALLTKMNAKGTLFTILDINVFIFPCTASCQSLKSILSEGIKRPFKP